MDSTRPGSLPPSLETALDEVASVERLLVATDFDGVLAPFVVDPLNARPQPGTIETLLALAAAGDAVAVVSGRDLETLTRLTGLGDSPITRIGSHGAQSSRSAAATEPSEGERELLSRLVAEVQTAVAEQAPLVRLEHKPAAVVLHTRDLDEASAAAAGHIAEQATRHDGVRLLRGKGVFELSVVHADKGTALRALAEELAVDAVVYLGDDVTDEDAFAVLGPVDVGVKVGAGETVARERVDDLRLVPAVLDGLRRRREDRAG